MLDAATRELAHLDKSVGRRVVERIRWLAENLDDLSLESLTGGLSGLYNSAWVTTASSKRFFEMSRPS